MTNIHRIRRTILKTIVRLRSGRSNAYLYLSRAASFGLLVGLACVAWLVFSFARTSFAGADSFPDTVNQVESHRPSAHPPKSSRTIDSTFLTRRDIIVYVVEGDDQHFHCTGHVSDQQQRRAISFKSAKSRGLKPCSVCYRGKSLELNAINANSR